MTSNSDDSDRRPAESTTGDEAIDGRTVDQAVLDRLPAASRRRFVKAAAAGTLAAGLGATTMTGQTAAVTTSSITPGDGFADVAPWLESTNPTIHRVTEPTRSAVASAFHASGPRVVVFETSGTIDLGGSTLAITNDRCWVAGQTAPSPGITFVNGMVQVDANDCVVQHVRSRIGPGPDGNIQGNDSLNTQDGTSNNVVDHVTASWGTDECLSVGYDTDRTTVSNCLIYEGLYDPYGDGSDHNYGSLIGDDATDVALLGNVWAKARGRIPRLKGGTRSVVANNLTYFFDEAANCDDSTVTSFVGNVYLGTTDTGDSVLEGGEASLSDNVATDPPLGSGTAFASTSIRDSRPLWPDGFSAMGSGQVERHNLANAGARPADRTANDARIVQEIRDRAGNDRLDSPYDYWIPHPSAVGGYPQLPENTHVLNVPSSGLRDWLAEWAAVVETGDGNPGGEDSTAPTTPSGLAVTATTTSSADVSWNASSDSGGSGLAHYTVYVDGSRDQQVAAGTTAATVSGLAADTSYQVSVSAVDGARNESDRSAAVTATTDADSGGWWDGGSDDGGSDDGGSDDGGSDDATGWW